MELRNIKTDISSLLNQRFIGVIYIKSNTVGRITVNKKQARGNKLYIKI